MAISTKHIDLAIFFTAILVGVYARFSGLGSWDLAVDEYYLTQSILNIIEHGVPAFDCGGYYLRGILQQYLTAPLVLWLPNTEFAVRLLPAVCNTISTILVYLIARKCGNLTVAVGACLLFLLSLWEIEFARFGRMYAPFQMLFLFQVFLLLKYVPERPRGFYAIAFVAFVSIFVYEGALFLVVLCLVPFIKYKKRPTYTEALVLAFIIIFVVIYLTTPFRYLGAQPHLPVDFISPTTSGKLPIAVPDFIFPKLFDSLLWLPIASPLLIFVLYSCRYFIKRPDLKFLGKASGVVILLAILFNQLLLAFSVFLLAILYNAYEINNSPSRLKGPLSLLVLNAVLFGIFWGLFSWLQLGNDFYEIIKSHLKYPDFLSQFLVPWYRAIPNQLAITLVVLTIGSALLVRKVLTSKLLPQQDSTLLLVSILFTSLLLQSALDTNYTTTRYTFYLLPISLILISVYIYRLTENVSKKVGRQVVFYIPLTFFMLVSETYGLSHLKQISSENYNFRIGFSAYRENLYYQRWDFRSPAQHVNENISPDDLVINMVRVADHYLGQVDYTYQSGKSGEFPVISACGGTKYIWNNTDLIYTYEGLSEIIEGGDAGIWILSPSMKNKYKSDAAIEINKRYSDSLTYTNFDETIVVYYLNKKDVF